jgi:hypothetical protein
MQLQKLNPSQQLELTINGYRRFCITCLLLFDCSTTLFLLILCFGGSSTQEVAWNHGGLSIYFSQSLIDLLGLSLLRVVLLFVCNIYQGTFSYAFVFAPIVSTALTCLMAFLKVLLLDQSFWTIEVGILLLFSVVISFSEVYFWLSIRAAVNEPTESCAVEVVSESGDIFYTASDTVPLRLRVIRLLSPPWKRSRGDALDYRETDWSLEDAP